MARADPVTVTPHILARNRPETIRLAVVPSIFTVAPRGMEKLAILGDTPSFSVHIAILVGMDAELDDRARAVSMPSFAFL